MGLYIICSFFFFLSVHIGGTLEANIYNLTVVNSSWWEYCLHYSFQITSPPRSPIPYPKQDHSNVKKARRKQPSVNNSQLRETPSLVLLSRLSKISILCHFNSWGKKKPFQVKKKITSSSKHTKADPIIHRLSNAEPF